MRAWQSLVQFVAPADSSIASSPSTPPIRPPEATDQRVVVPSWYVLVATCGLSLPSSIWWVASPATPSPKLTFPVYSLTK